MQELTVAQGSGEARGTRSTTPHDVIDTVDAGANELAAMHMARMADLVSDIYGSAEHGFHREERSVCATHGIGPKSGSAGQ
jgi:hypothetical protein